MVLSNKIGITVEEKEKEEKKLISPLIFIIGALILYLMVRKE